DRADRQRNDRMRANRSSEARSRRNGARGWGSTTSSACLEDGKSARRWMPSLLHLGPLPSPPGIDFIAIRRGKARRTHSLETGIVLDARGVAGLGGGERSRGETAGDVQRAGARAIDVPDQEAATGIDGGMDLEIAPTRHAR